MYTKKPFPKCHGHQTWTVWLTRWNENSNEHVPIGTWWRHHDFTLHFWKPLVGLPKMLWTWWNSDIAGTRWKDKFEWAWNPNRHPWWRHHDVTWHFWKTHFPKWWTLTTWTAGPRWKENSNEHVSIGTWWRHHDVTWLFLKNTLFQNAMNMKLGQ